MDEDKATAKDKVRLHLGVAAIGFLGTLVGGVTTGVFAYKATSRQVQSAAAQSQEDFARTQRLTVYTRVFEDHVASSTAADALMAELRATDDFNLTNLRAARRAFDGAFGRLREDMHAVDLIEPEQGQGPTAMRLTRVYKSHERLYHRLSAQAEEAEDRRSAVGVDDALVASVRKDLEQEIAAFREVAELDLELRDLDR